MEYEKHEETEGDLTTLTYTLKKPHPWLSLVAIEVKKGQSPEVVIYLHDDELLGDKKSLALVKEKMAQLNELHEKSIRFSKAQFFDKLTPEENEQEKSIADTMERAIMDKFRGQSTGDSAMDYIMGGNDVTFHAGPRSMIKDVLAKADLPKNISADISKQLAAIWAKTPP